MGWIKVCDEKTLKNGDLLEYDHGEMKILITKIKDKIFATGRICTHAYADLSTGFLNEEEKTITCPLHMSAFNLENGVPQNAPAELPLKTYNTKIEDKSLYVLIN
ncbi:MAG: non-heme iron oxygenase ferredoxin subunit [Thermoleophilaceae bacterium]|nr:non-heme iron oxygenase ferredoxin subunit [Thermoleophilaceae bacterium]